MAGRKPKYREFLITMKEALDLDTVGLAKAIGKQRTNVSQYISGTKPVGLRNIKNALEQIQEWRVRPLLEVQAVPDRLKGIPQTPGIYALYDSSASILYLGQAKHLRSELTQTLNRKSTFPVRSGPQLTKKHRPKYKAITSYLSVYEVRSARLRHNLEALLLRLFPNQSHNNKLGRFR